MSYSTENTKKQKITNSNVAFQVLLGSWNTDTLELQEEFKILMLNYANDVLGAVALKCYASNIIIAHNHPSGNLFPSESDKIITSKIKKASHLLDIKLIDHLIITKNGYYSFSEFGLLS